MRALIILTMLVLVCAGCWMVASVISPDAVAMAVGMAFGVLAGIPTTLLMMAGDRQRSHDDDDYNYLRPMVQPNQPYVKRVDFDNADHYAISTQRNQADAFDILLRCGGSLEHYGDGQVVYRAPSGKVKTIRYTDIRPDDEREDW